ncbi:MAG TPA: hypothetical protein VLA83_18005 [Candidatus Binatia bacterium]|nr:hypothetical protein [Candidatus Binatia bacterium]
MKSLVLAMSLMLPVVALAGQSSTAGKEHSPAAASQTPTVA